ncbi:carotenoid 1,2-hydratase [Vibrio metschnikovii]|nr:carotenoid 1,2-hydratase [Vibrio metschnikovii]EKO3675352.1 carotenoid 1,2-hydratase [Vibrio metschnikovii]
MSNNMNHKRWLIVVVLVALGLLIGFLVSHFLTLSADRLSSVTHSIDEQQFFAFPSADNPVRLPQDFALHPQYQHEWWHVFANVQDEQGQEYGIVWNFFKLANDSEQGVGWQNSQLFLSHVAVANAYQVWQEQRIARGGIGQADVTTPPFRMWIDNWHWRSLSAGPLPSQLDIATDNFQLAMHMTPKGPYILPGEQGFQRRQNHHSSLASYSVYAPFVSIQGTLRLTPYTQPIAVRGQAWISKEWGSRLIGQDQQGLDWFVLHLDQQRTLSVTRHRYLHQRPHIDGTLASKDGKVTHLTEQEIKMIPLPSVKLANGKTLPLQWQVVIAKENIDITLSPLNPNLWLDFTQPYWQGPIHSQGSHSARGFMQLTGY